MSLRKEKTLSGEDVLLAMVLQFENYAEALKTLGQYRQREVARHAAQCRFGQRHERARAPRSLPRLVRFGGGTRTTDAHYCA